MLPTANLFSNEYSNSPQRALTGDDYSRCSCWWGWDYVSKLRPPTDLSFIPHMLYEFEEPRWNDIDGEKLLIRPPERSRRNMAKEMLNLPTKYLFHTRRFFNMPQSYDMGPTALLPLCRNSCYSFLSPLKIPSSSAGFEPANLGSNVNHTTTRPPRATYRWR
jgi:hypothetical protein